MFSFAKKLVDRLEGHVPNNEDESYFKGTTKINNNGYALRVLHVVPHSHASLVGLEPWFDFIVKINNHELPMKYPIASTPSYGINDDGSITYGAKNANNRSSEVDYENLVQELATVANESRTITLDVWSAKGGVLRTVTVPMAAYSYVPQKLDIERFHDKFQQIGMTVQSQHVNTATYVWHVLNTHLNSPAFQAQLIPYSDYVIGCDSAFSDADGKGLLAKGGEALFSRTIMSYYNHHYANLGEDNIPITLYVYNHDYNILRPVTIHLSTTWATGNTGILGCDVGYGLLHRLPEVVGKFDYTYEKVDDVLFENNADYLYHLDAKSVPKPKSPPLTSSLMGMTAFIPEEFISPPRPSTTPITRSTGEAPSGYSQVSGTATNESSSRPLSSALMSNAPSTSIDPSSSNAQPTSSIPPLSNAISTGIVTSEPASASTSAPLSALGNSNVPITAPSSTEPNYQSSDNTTTTLAPPQTLAPPPTLGPPRLTIPGATIAPPAVTRPLGVPPSIAPPKIHRKKKHYASNGVSSLTDFMNEELSKSKNSDVMYPNGNGNTPPPPPPPRSAR